MLKKTITYTNYNGESVTEDFYFNLSKAELMELELSKKGGFRAYIDSISKSNDPSVMIKTFKDIIRMSYGVKSADGTKFYKREEDADDFMCSEAYSSLFMEFFSDADAASKFINGIIPTDIAAQVAANKESAVDIAKSKADISTL